MTYQIAKIDKNDQNALQVRKTGPRRVEITAEKSSLIENRTVSVTIGMLEEDVVEWAKEFLESASNEEPSKREQDFQRAWWNLHSRYRAGLITSNEFYLQSYQLTRDYIFGRE